MDDLFDKLDQLNHILKSYVRINLNGFCHIGAIEKNSIYLFVYKQEMVFMLRRYLQDILNHFMQHGYNFDKVILKVDKYYLECS